MVKVGDKVPHATLRGMGPEGPKPITTEELFAPGKKVVAFALPGAFTPTCSAKHVPGFVTEFDKIKAKAGDKVMMLGDGSAEFTNAMGLSMDLTKNGMGVRSQRYAMIVQDGVIKDLFVEKPGAFEVSAAENVLKHL